MKVLVVEDEARTRTGLEDLVSELGYEVRGAATVAQARQVLDEWNPDVCLTDLVLPDGDGLEIVRLARDGTPSREVVVMTGHGSVEAAVNAMKAGAFDFLPKPLKPPHLVTVLRHCSQKLDLDREGEAGHPPDPAAAGAMVGRSEEMQELHRVIARVARSDAPVMITGESGAGKEAAATGIHSLSRRRARPFVAVNCGAVSSTLIESELFGHEKGAFTGAERRRAGYFEMADGGTLFLDEVTEMSPELQVKFLRVLETRTFRRVGGNEELIVDVRVLSSSNRDPEEAVRSEKLRGDLYYRLNVFPIRVPSLRERQADIPLLVAHFLERIEEQERSGAKRLEPAALELLAAHPWPGNVRELRNVVHRAYVLSDGPVIGREDVRQVLGQQSPRGEAPPPVPVDPTLIPVRLGQSLAEVEREVLRRTLEHAGGNRSQAAAILKISVKTIYNKIKKYGL